MQVNGHEMLRYKPFRPQVGLIRGTTADPEGNITLEDEALCMENFEGAMAVANSGGIVIAQVERLSDKPALPHAVRIPGMFVHYIVVASSRQAHPHTLFTEHDPSFAGTERTDLEREFVPMPLNAEKVMCRRAAMELGAAKLINLGIGIPMSVASVAHEEGILNRLVLNTEIGVLGGLPQGGKNFGPSKNPSAFMSQTAMFDFYDGGGLDLSCVGMAQVDQEGNVNVSKIGHRIIGCGGFINITQSTKTVIFAGEFTASGRPDRGQRWRPADHRRRQSKEVRGPGGADYLQRQGLTPRGTKGPLCHRAMRIQAGPGRAVADGNRAGG